MTTKIADSLNARIAAILRRPASSMWMLFFLIAVVFYIAINVYLTV